MIKKTKDCYKQIAEKIIKALDYNKENSNSPIKLVSIEISRGLYNVGADVIRKKVMEEVGEVQDDIKFKVQDNDWECKLFIGINNIYPL